MTSHFRAPRFAAVITAVLFAGMIYAWLKGSFAARSRRLDLVRASEEAEVRAGHSVVHAEVYGVERVEQVKRTLTEASSSKPVFAVARSISPS